MNTKSLKEAAGFHGHVCPGLAIGWRVSKKALEELGGRAEDEELVVVVENDSCAVDAVQVMTGCTFGKGNLVFHDYGKQVYTFIKRPSGDALRISVDWTPPPETFEEKAAWDRYSAGERSEEVLRAVHDRKSRKIDAIMDAEDEELFKVQRRMEEIPRPARIYPSVICSRCGEKVMEARARLRDGRIMCLPCFESED